MNNSLDSLHVSTISLSTKAVPIVSINCSNYYICTGGTYLKQMQFQDKGNAYNWAVSSSLYMPKGIQYYAYGNEGHLQFFANSGTLSQRPALIFKTDLNPFLHLFNLTSVMLQYGIQRGMITI